MTYWVSQLLNGLSFAMLLYLLAVGLTLTLGVMRLVNLTHGSFYLIGAYVALTVVGSTGSFIAGIVAATVAVTVLGAVVYPLLRLVGENDLRQSLLTFGLLFIIADLALVVWGGSPQTVSKPELLEGATTLGAFTYPTYRLFLIVIGAVIAVVLEVVQRRSMFGAMVRAVVDDAEMAGGVGRDAHTIAAVAFVVGAALAGLAGGLGGGLIGVFPSADVQVLLFALIIVIVGGMGSVTGALVGALTVGILDTLGRAFVPQLGSALIFLLMLATLVVRPTGLFGREA